MPLVSYNGRLLRSQYGRLVARPVSVIADPQAREAFELGADATATANITIGVSDSFALDAGASANPPGAGVLDSMTFGSGAANTYVAQASVSDGVTLDAGAAATVSLALLSTNNGPYPRLNPTRAGTQWDNTGKAYTTATAGTTEFNNVTGLNRDFGATGLTETGFTILGNPGNVFAIQGNSLAVRQGQVVGVAGTVYELSFYIGTSDGNSHTRYVRVTSV